MGRRGPSRLPTNVIKLRGKPGHARPINEDEPKFDSEIEIPPHISAKPDALAEWQRRAPELETLGLLNGQYQTEFADYCLQHAYYLECQKEIEGLGIKEAIAAGVWKAFQTASQQRTRLASKFGFTPSDSSGIKVRPNDKPRGAKRFLA